MALRRTARYCAAAGPDGTALWMRAVGVRPGLIAEDTRRCGPSQVPVRCLVAKASVVRGERLCVVPQAMLLTGRTADRHLRLLLRTGRTPEERGGVSPPLRGYEEVAERLRAVPAASPRLLASRDALLMTAVLYLLRRPQHYGAIPPPALAAWARTLPPRVPPLGLLLRATLEERDRHVPLQRRLSLGNLSVPLLPGASAQAAATELVVAAVEAHGLAEGLRTPCTEVVLTQAMLADFHEGRHTALTARQFEAAAAHTLHHSSSAAVRRLAALEVELQGDVLGPLLEALSPLSAQAAGAEEVAVAAGAEAMRWAHFMLRSRALNLRYRRGPAQLAVVPFLDRLNHSHTGANVTYTCRPSSSSSMEGEEEGEEVVVMASRAIRPGEELLLHYGNVGQRGCLFGDVHGSENGLRDGDGVDAATRQVRAAEARQHRELSLDEDAEAEAQCPVFRLSPHDTTATSEHSARGNEGTKAAAEREATAEATWLWRYGFLRPEAERALEASHRWNRGLRERLAHLTDVRRKGAPGAFVVGVPEGLAHLREQRESLERERYGNTRVFPPQQS